ncbi:MAG: hypothetical protein EHM59_15680 [Betaproteobacteria bacterium]|nr:MAG: hypothetical protein EHM59_15680 [Betaproteobacteria bacterium]
MIGLRIADMIGIGLRRAALLTRKTMRDALLALALSLYAAATAAQGAAVAVNAPQVDTPKRILFVGNSYIYYNGSLNVHANRIARNADPSGGYAYRAATIAGAPLHYHAIEHLITPGKLGVKEPFEVVILQTNSTDAMSERSRAQFRQTAIEFNNAIAKRGAKTALYMTQAHVKPSKYAGSDMLQRTAEMYVEVGNEIGAMVIPVGLAFEEAYRRRPDMKLHFALDGSHPSLLGTYLAACTVYATLYARRSEGNAYDYQGTIAREDALFLQEVADDTVSKFFGRPLR